MSYSYAENELEAVKSSLDIRYDDPDGKLGQCPDGTGQSMEPLTQGNTTRNVPLPGTVHGEFSDPLRCVSPGGRGWRQRRRRIDGQPQQSSRSRSPSGARNTGQQLQTTYTENAAGVSITDRHEHHRDGRPRSARVVLTNAQPGDDPIGRRSAASRHTTSIDTTVDGQITLNLTGPPGSPPPTGRQSRR